MASVPRSSRLSARRLRERVEELVLVFETRNRDMISHKKRKRNRGEGPTFMCRDDHMVWKGGNVTSTACGSWQRQDSGPGVQVHGTARAALRPESQHALLLCCGLLAENTEKAENAKSKKYMTTVPTIVS